jgi:hypothetical protein
VARFLARQSASNPAHLWGLKDTEIHAKGIACLLYEDFGNASLMGRCDPWDGPLGWSQMG